MSTCLPPEFARTFPGRLIVFVIVLIFFVVSLVLGCPPPVAISLAVASTAIAQSVCDPGSVPWRDLLARLLGNA